MLCELAVKLTTPPNPTLPIFVIQPASQPAHYPPGDSKPVRAGQSIAVSRLHLQLRPASQPSRRQSIGPQVLLLLFAHDDSEFVSRVVKAGVLWTYLPFSNSLLALFSFLLILSPFFILFLPPDLLVRGFIYVLVDIIHHP